MNRQFILNRFITIIMLFGLLSCNTSKVSPEEFSRFMNNPENGLSKERTVNGITIKVKHLPASLLAYKEFKELSMNKSSQLDSLRNTYASGLTFLMEIVPEDKKDIMLQGIHSEEEYKERVNLMNFNLKEFLELSISGNSIAPSIANLENIYGLKNGRKIMIVFPLKEPVKSKEDLLFTFTDEIYATGINHFTFSSKDIEAIPDIKL